MRRTGAWRFKYVALGVLTCAALIGVAVYAQSLGVLAPQTSMRFSRVEFREVDSASGFFVGRIDMGDGTACYVASSRQLATTLDNLSQLMGLGCVRE